jgi:predicted metal-dependent HD superfamily phosphohydrolase
MYPPVVTKDPTAVEVQVQAAYVSMFPDGDRTFVPRAFGWTVECFQGKYKDYQAVDAPYHDLEHTLQGALCMARLLRGRHFAGAQPRLSQPLCELGLLAMLLHDAGYLKKRSDTEGTGAKYTVIHVDRSAVFAAELLGEKGFSPKDIKAVQNMIHCTGVDTRLNVIPFQSEMEKILGFALGTTDLLGQMAAEDYVEKLPLLYAEFAEAARYLHDKTHIVARYSSADDLLRKTPDFWDTFVRAKLDRDFAGLWRFLNDPYPDGPNSYIGRIEANMERLRERLQAPRR